MSERSSLSLLLPVCSQHALVGDGDWHKCKKLQRLLFDTSSCTHASCSFGGAYQPALPKNFYGFSYLYDRVAAIGLLDGKPAQYGSQVATIADIEKAGAALCALEQSKVAERFSSHPDAQKASNFCGDVAYLSTLLQSFGFSNTDTITMTNKIKVRLRVVCVGEGKHPPAAVDTLYSCGRALSWSGRWVPCWPSRPSSRRAKVPLRRSPLVAASSCWSRCGHLRSLPVASAQEVLLTHSRDPRRQALALYAFFKRRAAGGYRHVSLPLAGHESGESSCAPLVTDVALAACAALCTQ